MNRPGHFTTAPEAYRTYRFLLQAHHPLGYIDIPMATLIATEIRNFFAGRWQAPTSEAGLELTNPATGEPLGRSPAGSAAEVDAAVNAAHAAFPQWRATPAADRVQFLFKL